MIDKIWYFKNEEQYWKRSQWKELFKSLPKLVTISYWLICWSPTHRMDQIYHHDNHGCRCHYKDKHCWGIPQCKSFNESNIILTIFENEAVNIRRVESIAMGYQEVQQLSPLVRVVRSQRTTIQASSGSCGILQNRKDVRPPTSWRVALSTGCTHKPSNRSTHSTIDIRTLAVIDKDYFKHLHNCKEQRRQYLVESQSVDELLVKL